MSNIINTNILFIIFFIYFYNNYLLTGFNKPTSIAHPRISKKLQRL